MKRQTLFLLVALTVFALVAAGCVVATPAPAPPAGPVTACSPPSSRLFEVQCDASDNCDADPEVREAAAKAEQQVRRP